MKRYVITTLSMFACIAMLAASATFKKIWLEYNVMQNGEKGIKVHVAFDISGMKDQSCKAIAYFDHPKGIGVKDRNGRYCTAGGNVCSRKQFTPHNQNSTFSDLSIFIPISELHLLSGKRTYYTRVFIQMPNGKFLANSDFVAFVGTGSSESDYDNNNANNSNQNSNPGRRWREDAGHGMFYDCQEMNGGIVSKTLYATCMACRGSSACGNCHGTATCTICRGRGGITTAGYGRFIPCTACSQSGRCRVCKGSGRCVCSSSDFPGYVAGANTLYAADGRILSTNSFRVGDDSSDSSEPSHSSSSSSSRGSCSNCGGTGVDPTPGGGLASWAAYYNSEGSKCPYCGRYTSHMHDKCASCNVPRY